MFPDSYVGVGADSCERLFPDNTEPRIIPGKNPPLPLLLLLLWLFVDAVVDGDSGEADRGYVLLDAADESAVVLGFTDGAGSRSERVLAPMPTAAPIAAAFMAAEAFDFARCSPRSRIRAEFPLEPTFALGATIVDRTVSLGLTVLEFEPNDPKPPELDS